MATTVASAAPGALITAVGYFCCCCFFFCLYFFFSLVFFFRGYDYGVNGGFVCGVIGGYFFSLLYESNCKRGIHLGCCCWAG